MSDPLIEAVPALIFRSYEADGSVSFDVLTNSILEPGTKLYLHPTAGQDETLRYQLDVLALELTDLYERNPGTMRLQEAVAILAALGHSVTPAGQH